MSSAAVVFVLLATVWVSSTVALDTCSEDIVAGLSQHPECYTSGLPPTQQTGTNHGTHVIATNGEIPEDATCTIGWQEDGYNYATFYFSDKPALTTRYNAVVYPNYIEEIPDEGDIRYRLYVIHNEGGAYSYYRCISENGEGTGTLAVHVAVGCAYTTNNVTLAVVERAKVCFNKLGIKNYVTLTPCDC